MSYAELHCKTNFSFLTGASHADELVDRAVELGYTALAVTDENTLAGVVRAFGAARHTELKLIIGAEIILNDAPPSGKPDRRRLRGCGSFFRLRCRTLRLERTNHGWRVWGRRG